MLLNPSILALLGCSAIVCGLTVMAAGVGLAVAVGWNHLDSGPAQLLRERRWFLVVSSLRLVLWLQAVSLLVFVATADRLKTLFTGAMCAVGSLRVNPFGAPALAAKTAAFVLCALWLVTDRATVAATGTGLVRFKVGFLTVLAGVLVAENVLQLRYVSGLDPDVITSCCATVFDPGAGGAAAELASLPVGWSRLTFFGVLAATLATGLWTISRRCSTVAYSLMSFALGLVTAAAVVTWIAPAYYELPTHHCPLCLMAPEHGFVGYPLYLFLSAAVITGVGSGLIHLLRSLDVQRAIPASQEQRLCAASIASFAAVAAMASWPLVTSPFRLEVSSILSSGGVP